MSNPARGGGRIMRETGRGSFLDVLDQEARRRLLAEARVVRARKGQAVLARGEGSTDAFLVQEGQLQAVLYAADGREVSLRELSEGQLFGELSALDGEARSVGIIAATDARLLAIGQDLFREILATCPAAADWLLRRLTNQVRSLTDRVFELSALNVQARLHCELIRIARAHGSEIDPAPTHAELANRIGTHREAVTRELNDLEARDILRSGRRRLAFLDLDRLEREVRTRLRTPVEDHGWW